MKKLFFAIGFVVAGTVCANAQTELVQPSNYTLLSKGNSSYYSKIVVNNRLDFNEKKFQKCKRMRTAGIVLTAVGAGVTIAGVSVINATKNHNYTKHDVDTNIDNTVNYAGGIILTGLGSSMIGGGITMWAIGNAKMKKYSNSLSIGTNENGVSVAFKF